MRIPNRGAGGVSYRYGFNGKETENYVKGIGNEQDYGMRIYDPRLGRFLSVDPLAKSYSWYTPFSFAGNKPTYALNLDGKEEKIYIFNFTKEKIYKVAISLPKAGPLGNGVAVIIIKNNQTQFLYGEKISGEVPVLGERYSASEALRNFKAKAEGKYDKLYTDNLGFPTIGIGHLVKKEEEDKYNSKTTLTEQEITDLFNADISVREPDITSIALLENLNQNQADAVMDFHFNTGRAKEFSKKESSKDGYLFLKYMKGGRGLWKRRIAEYLIFSEGIYIDFKFIDQQKKQNKLILLFDENYYQNKYKQLQEQEHTKSTNNLPVTTTTANEKEN